MYVLDSGYHLSARQGINAIAMPCLSGGPTMIINSSYSTPAIIENGLVQARGPSRKGI